MKIEILNKNRYPLYDDFLHTHHESLLYYSLKYKDFLEELLGCESRYQLAVEDEKITGVFPLMKKDGPLGSVYNSLPFYGSNGGIISSDPRAFRLLTAEYNRILAGEGVAAGTVVGNPLSAVDFSLLDYDLTDKRIGQWTPLPDAAEPEKDLMARFDSSARRNIRKALKSGITSETDPAMMDFLMDVHTRNMTAIGGKAKKDIFFKLIPRHFDAGTDYNIYVARLENQPVAALLLFYFNNTVEYFTPAVLEEYRSLQPLALLVQRAMIDAACKGFHWWNWGGTWVTQEGVYRFKKKWGAVDKEYTYHTKINNKEIYNRSKEELLRFYDNFYVVDFSKLHA